MKESLIDERHRRTLANTAVAMDWVGTELVDHAQQVADKVFDHLGISASEAREAQVAALFSEMEEGGERSFETMESIALRQGQVAISEQRERHADQALRRAVSVQFQYHRVLSPLTAPVMGQFESDLQSAYKQMQLALLEAQRHLAALDILKNLEGKHYSERARKGGHAKARPASKQDQQMLLAVIIKNMLYNDPGATKRKPSALAHEWAKRVYEINSEFEFLNITSLDQLQSEVHTLLLKYLKAGQGVERQISQRIMVSQLLNNKDEYCGGETDRIKAELSHKRSFFEGLQGALMYLLESRFGELPDEALEALRAKHRMEDLQACMDRLLEATSWQAVLRDSAPTSSD